ncbi:MAG: DUF5979 domain-containing protein, partial [Candidatus Promineifilaceae bacterium]|nr:DUF5979 domain-containing protein [Candidatus Promineifilaceae bacterium]
MLIAILLGAEIGPGAVESASADQLIGPQMADRFMRVSEDTEAGEGSGTISIKKVTDPAGGTGFEFSSDIPSASSFNLPDDTRLTITDVPVGTYTVTEEDPGPLYELASISCSSDGESEVTLDKASRSVTIDLADDGQVSCIFTNDKQVGSISIKKVT